MRFIEYRDNNLLITNSKPIGLFVFSLIMIIAPLIDALLSNQGGKMLTSALMMPGIFLLLSINITRTTFDRVSGTVSIARKWLLRKKICSFPISNIKSVDVISGFGSHKKRGSTIILTCHNEPISMDNIIKSSDLKIGCRIESFKSAHQIRDWLRL